MNQFTKSVVVVSTFAAALVELYLATPYRPTVMWIAIAGFAIAAIFGTRAQGILAPSILFSIYLMPAAYLVLLDYEHFSLEIVWILPLMGLIMSGRGAWHWALPQSWRWPLVTWALVVAVSWPIVFLREVDFSPWILPLNVSNTSSGISPWQAGLSLTYAVLVHNTGLLWIDALFRWFSRERSPWFTSRILWPQAAAAAVACLAGVYQALVDVTFVSGHLWPHMRRAAGTLADANTFGVIAALWAPALLVLAHGFPQPWPIVAGTGGVALAAMGVLASGSRTALIALTIGLAAVAFEGFMAWRKAGALMPSAKRLAPLVIGVLVLAVIVQVVARGWSITSVVARGSLGYIPGVGDLGIRESAWLLWDRFGYGSAAVRMITEHPWVGVGVGSFHTLVHDFAKAVSGQDLVSDNAQNWYRHLLAELGLLGSLPWIAWCAIFAATLLSRSPGSGDRFALGILRGSLAGFGIISLLGMPGQSLPVVLTFWTLAFWFWSLKGSEAPTARGMATSTWVATLALVAIHTVITYADARGDLLPRNRSTRFGWDYRYGIDNAEPSLDGSPGRRWTERRSLSVIPVRGKVLKFVGWIDHPDGDERPVHVRVWADSKIVYDGDLKRSAAIYLDIPATTDKTHMVVETEISRMWKPRDFGRIDSRERRGWSVRDWTWE